MTMETKMPTEPCKSCGSYPATRPDGLCDGCGSARDGGASVATAYGDRTADLCAEVAAMVGDDGTGNLGAVVRQALADDPAVTVGEVAQIWRQAERDHAADLAAEQE